MTAGLRETGIDVVGSIPWGSHLCHFYETKEDLLDILVPYFKAGLENNEFCLWVVSDPLGPDEAASALRRAFPEGDRHLSSGGMKIVPHPLSHLRQQASPADSIEIVPHTKWYLKDGSFNAELMIDAWREKLDEALAQGYAGLRVNGNEAWLTEENWEDFGQYEKALDEVFSGQRMMVLCSYPLAKAGAAEILDVARTHQLAVVRRKGSWEVVETPELKEAKAEVRRLNEELEQRVIERTEELAAANEELRREIGERKRVEERLKQSEGQLAEAQSLAHVGSWNWDLRSNTITWSDEHYRIFGVDPRTFDPAFDGTFMNAICAEDRALVRGAVESSLKTLEPCNFYYRILRPDGEERVLHARGSVVSDEHGNPLRMFGTAQDVTERKRAEEELKDSRRRLEQAQRIAHVGHYEHDLDTGAIVMSDENYRILGLPPQESITLAQAFEYIHPDDRERLHRAREEAVRKGQRIVVDYRNVRPDGGVRYIHSESEVFYDEEGRPRRTFGIAQDITERKLAEEALRESEDRIRLIIDTIPVMTWTVQPDGVVDFLSQRWMEYAGLSFEQYMTDQRGLIHPQDTPRVIEKWRAQMALGEVYDDEMRLRRADGEYRWFLVRTAPLRDEQGNVVKWYGVSIDIEDRKCAEEALKESQQKLEEAQRIAHVGHWERDLDTGLVIWSDEIYRIFGLPPQEIVLPLTEWQHLLHPEDRERVALLIEEAQRGDRRYEVEYRIVRPDGEVRFIHSQGDVIRDEQGRPRRAFGIAQDITERKLAEEELKKEKEVLKKVFDNAPVLIGFVGEDGRVKLVNPEWERTMGWTLKELEERDVDIFAEAYPDLSYRQDVLDFVAASTGEWVDLKIKVRDGRVIDAACAVVHLSDGTRVAIAQDITERKRAEEMLQTYSQRLIETQEAERRRVARELHDEIGQALTAVKINLQAVQHSAGASPLAAQLNESTGLVDRALQQVRDLSFNLRPSLLDDLGLIAALRWYVDREARRADLVPEFVADLSDTRLPPELETACFRITQEALTNVVRHAQATQIWVELRQRGSELHLTIRDDGIGFEAGNARRRRASTVGLGLQGMQERALILGGKLEIKSAPERGTEVHVWFPLPDTVSTAAKSEVE